MFLQIHSQKFLKFCSEMQDIKSSEFYDGLPLLFIARSDRENLQVAELWCRNLAAAEATIVKTIDSQVLLVFSEWTTSVSGLCSGRNFDVSRKHSLSVLFHRIYVIHDVLNNIISSYGKNFITVLFSQLICRTIIQYPLNTNYMATIISNIYGYHYLHFS